MKLGKEIESFEMSRQLIAQKSKIPNPTLRSRRVSLNQSIKNDGRSFAQCYVGLFSQQILWNFLESV